MKVVPVAGVVKYKDAPVADVDLVFYPVNGPVGIGKTDAKGAFQITTNGKAGCIPGKHRVTVASSKQDSAVPSSDGRAFEFTSQSTLPKKYMSQDHTDLVVEIANTGNKDLKLELND